MNASFLIGWGEFKALMPIVSTDETRYVLNGIHVEASKRKLLLVATDGRRMGIINSETVKDIQAGSEKVAFTVPSDLISAVKATARTVATIEFSDGALNIRVPNPKITYQAAAIDGNYPNWRQVVPSGPYKHAEKFSLNYSLLDDFRKVERTLGGGFGMKLYWQRDLKVSGDFKPEHQPYVIKGTKSSFMGILMPVKDATENLGTPDWLDLPAAQ